MGNISNDQKLQLVQMIRAESQDNRMKMRSREKILYNIENKHEIDGRELYALESAGNNESKVSFSSFKLRLILAVVLFATFLLLDAGNGNVAGITAKQLQEEINKNFDTGLQSIIFDFEHNFPYTLFSNAEQ